MRIYEAEKLDLTPPQWDSLVASDPQGHLLQTWAWGEGKRTFGWEVKRWVIKSENELIGGAQVLFQRQGPFLMAYLPKGPFYIHENPLAVKTLWQTIHRYCRHNGCFCLKLEPNWLDKSQDKVDWLAQNRFVSSLVSIQPRSTVIVDLIASEDDILGRMKQKWRYNIHLSERKGVEIHQVGELGLDSFYTMMQATGLRDQFGIHSLAYYRRFFNLFSADKRAHLLLATYQGLPLAGLMLFTFNRQAWYLYGASSNAHREMMPNQLLQWRAMQQAKRLGCYQYDLWGIQDTEPSQVAVDLSGVGRFKLGFGGSIVRYVGAYDYIYIKLLYWFALRYWIWQRRRRLHSAGGEAT
jgi:peptidoglycan pentaglycine glycine transferase (the first glycine)